MLCTYRNIYGRETFWIHGFPNVFFIVCVLGGASECRFPWRPEGWHFPGAGVTAWCGYWEADLDPSRIHEMDQGAFSHPYILILKTMVEVGKQKSFFLCTPVSLCNNCSFEIWSFKRNATLSLRCYTIAAIDKAIFWQSNQQGSYGNVLYVCAPIYIIHVCMIRCSYMYFFLRDLWKFCLSSFMKSLMFVSFFSWEVLNVYEVRLIPISSLGYVQFWLFGFSMKISMFVIMCKF